jgi:hypothetical protein
MLYPKAHKSSAAESRGGPELLSVADLLRDLQADMPVDARVSVSLDVDDKIHVTADKLLLSSVLETLLESAIATAEPGSQVVLGCRSEEAGVLIEIEYDPVQQPAAGASGSDDWQPPAVRAIPAELSREVVGNRLIVQLALSPSLFRTYAPPGF